MRGEDDLRAAMQVLAADPPTVEDVIGVVRPSDEKRRRRVWVLPVAAATVTLAVVLTVTALVSRAPTTHQPPQVRKPTATPTALVGVHWILLAAEEDGEAPTHGDASLTIARDGKFIANFWCGLWKGVVRISNRRAEFKDGVNVSDDCPYAPSNAVDIRTVESVLSGVVQWSLRNRLLTITKPGKGSLTYLPASMAATINGRLLAVGGPAAGAGRPLAGTVTLTTRGGKPLTMTVGSDGRYSVAVAPGTYQVQGHSPQYESGKWPCRAMRPADAATGTTTTVNVYCQEK